MVLKSDDGQLLEVKEGVLLNSNQEPLSTPKWSEESRQPGFKAAGYRVFRLGKASSLLIAIPLGLLIGMIALVIGLFSALLLIPRLFFSKKTLFQQRT